MAIPEVLGIFFDAAPTLRGLWRWLLERGLEVTMLPPREPLGTAREEKPTIIVGLGEGVAEIFPVVCADFALRFINHRSDR